ncbi:nickel pincer cofactor biosynthesis protein LarC [Nonomuraea guangzhouensis]|uniref:Pyridinium-3,5-bisthiocarboxylic acid mononucleotide nickel insertion protein n=1 Tax=Nonomuraea guangzhouensis TaxID=1291555 RepID=A0ABW4G222_9ACTN|nr:nickel pincer cofactor biosynthesis protein LarC [Nonomuraea guangzhouensis]
MRQAWIDASAGIAGDMLLAALLDAGADLEAVRAAVAAVIPDEVRLTPHQVTRAGLRATHVRVESTDHHPHRTWAEIRDLIDRATLPERVRADALAVFERLARAEARVHGVSVEDVHFHEVGAWDSIADVVGVCAALHDLGVRELSAGPVAVGSGRVRTAHGELPVPVPAVAELAAGRRILAGGEGELATPTGMALVTALARECPELPPMRLEATGVGAGGRDVPGRPNVVRVLLGTGRQQMEESILLEANIDDLDPRVWPSVLAALLEAGAADAWLVPILMKKGRPAHTLCALAATSRADPVRTAIFRLTTTLGVRERAVRKTALERGWAHVDVLGARLPIKVGYREGVIVQATPEFEDAARLAVQEDLPVRAVLDAALAAARTARLAPGEPVPSHLEDTCSPH